MKIYLIRHGETNWNRERRLQGHSDIPLNERGIELAEKTAESLREIPFDAAFSSPLERALTTARIIVGSRNISIQTDERLKEICFGAGEGTGFDLAKEDPAHPMHDFFRYPERFSPMEGGESIAQVRQRVADFFREKVFPLEGSCENVLVTAHGAAIRSFVNWLSGIPEQDFWQISLPNCAVVLLSLTGGEMRVLEKSRIYYDEPVNVRP